MGGHRTTRSATPDGSSRASTVTMFGCVLQRPAEVLPGGAEILEARWFRPRELSRSRLLAADMVDIVAAALAWFRDVAGDQRA